MTDRGVGARPFDKPRPAQAVSLAAALTFACPRCRQPLEAAGNAAYCAEDDITFEQVDGVWRFLLPEREAYFRQFVAEYEAVREAEGRGNADPAYYRALPYRDLSGRFSTDWRIRARSYDALVSQVVRRRKARRQRPLAVLDVGAGNGWLSNRLSEAGHSVAAVDLLTNGFDGLGAHVHYATDFMPVQAEFDRLPFASDQVDLVVFNGSFHYAVDYAVTLSEALRVLRATGQVVVMDSPVYQDADSGEQMVREREASFQARYGFPSNAIPSENYLTYTRLEELAEALAIRWRIIRPFYGWRWALRPWKARLLGRREPAQFLLAVGTPAV
jgi:SAM-dependent methyltransferase